jgi:hypothetical protein
MNDCQHLIENLGYVGQVTPTQGFVGALLRCLACRREFVVASVLHGGSLHPSISASAPCPEKDELRPPHSGMSL